MLLGIIGGACDDDVSELKPGISRVSVQGMAPEREAAGMKERGVQHRTPRGGEVAGLAVESRSFLRLIKVQSALQMALANPRAGRQRRYIAHLFCAMRAIRLVGRDVGVT